MQTALITQIEDYVLLAHVCKFQSGRKWYAYQFGKVNAAPLFVGTDYSCPQYASDLRVMSDLLVFMTLRPGDTDADYFDSYTPEQLHFAETDAENLSCYNDEEAPEFKVGTVQTGDLKVGWDVHHPQSVYCYWGDTISLWTGSPAVVHAFCQSVAERPPCHAYPVPSRIPGLVCVPYTPPNYPLRWLSVRAYGRPGPELWRLGMSAMEG